MAWAGRPVVKNVEPSGYERRRLKRELKDVKRILLCMEGISHFFTLLASFFENMEFNVFVTQAMMSEVVSMNAYITEYFFI